MNDWRQARAIALLPGNAMVVVPALILVFGDGPDLGWGLGGVAAALVWAGLFAAVNFAWFLLGEEPGLERRFGDEYRAYKSAVPRWIPRRSPWRPE